MGEVVRSGRVLRPAQGLADLVAVMAIGPFAGRLGAVAADVGTGRGQAAVLLLPLAVVAGPRLLDTHEIPSQCGVGGILLLAAFLHVGDEAVQAVVQAIDVVFGGLLHVQ